MKGSKTQIRKYIKKTIQKWLGPAFNVHVSRVGFYSDQDEWKRVWTLEVWERGESKYMTGITVSALTAEETISELRDFFKRRYI